MSPKDQVLHLQFNYVSRTLPIVRRESDVSLKSLIDELFKDMDCKSVALKTSFEDDILPLSVFADSPHYLDELVRRSLMDIIVVNETPFVFMKNEVPLLTYQSFTALLDIYHIGETVFPIDFVTLCTSILHCTNVRVVCRLTNEIFQDNSLFITRQALWEILSGFLQMSRCKRLSLLFRLYAEDNTDQISLNGFASMIAVFNWMNVVVYQMGHLFDISPFLVDGQKCASALFDDFRLSCHHSIRYSAVFEWLLYHGERFIPSQIHEVPITATLECNAGLLLSLWFFSLDHHKAKFSKSIGQLVSVEKHHIKLSSLDINNYLMAILRPDVSNNEYVYFRLFSSGFGALVGEAPSISQILFTLLSIYLIGSPDLEVKEIVRNFSSAYGRSLGVQDLRCFLECILRLTSDLSLTVPESISVNVRQVKIDQVMNEIRKILGIMDNAEIKEEIFVFIAKVCQMCVMETSASDPSTRICEELLVSYKPLNTRQETSCSHWSSFITNDNLLVYQEIDNCISPVVELSPSEPNQVSSSLFLHSIYNPDWSLGAVSMFSLTHLSNKLLISQLSLDTLLTTFASSSPPRLFFSDYSLIMERLYSTVPIHPTINHLTSFFCLLTWGHGATINRDELFLILMELLVVKLPYEEGFECLWKGLLKLTEATHQFSSALLLLFVQTQVHLFNSLFPSLTGSVGQDFSTIRQTLQSILMTHTPSLSPESESELNRLGIHSDSSYRDLLIHSKVQADLSLIKAVISTLLQENLLRIDLIMMNHSNPYYTRVHTLQQYLGVENLSIDSVVGIITRHTTDLSDQLMNLHDLLRFWNRFFPLELQSAYDQQRVMVITDIYELLSVMLKEKGQRIIDIREMCLFVMILLCNDIADFIQSYSLLYEKETQIISYPEFVHLLSCMFKTTVYIQTSLICHHSSQLIPLISSLLYQLDIQSNDSILTSHLRTLLTLHSALFLPCSSILTMTIPILQTPYNAVVTTLRQKYPQFLDCIHELQRIAKDDSYGCVYRGDIYNSFSYLHDTPKNMMLLLRVLSFFITDAEQENQESNECISVSSLLKSYCVICNDQPFIQTYFADSADNELRFDDVCSFFDCFYRIHALLFKCVLNPLSRQRLAALHSQCLFEEVNAIYPSTVTIDDVSHYVHNHQLLLITEHADMINNQDELLARRLSTNPAMSLPIRSSLREIASMDVKEAVPLSGNILPSMKIPEAAPGIRSTSSLSIPGPHVRMVVPTATSAVPTAVPAASVPTATPIIPPPTILSSAPGMVTPDPRNLVHSIPIVQSSSQTMNHSSLVSPLPVDNRYGAKNQTAIKSSAAASKPSLPTYSNPPLSYPQPPNPCPTHDKSVSVPSSCPLSYSDLRNAKNFAEPPSMTLHTGDGHTSPLPAYPSPLMSPSKAIPDVPVTPSLSSAVRITKSNDNVVGIPTVQMTSPIPHEANIAASLSPLPSLTASSPLPSLTAEVIPTVYSEVSIPLSPLPSTSHSISDHFIPEESEQDQPEEILIPIKQKDEPSDKATIDSIVLKCLDDYACQFDCDLMELDTLLQGVTAPSISALGFDILTKSLGSQNNGVLKELYLILDKMRQNAVNPRHLRAVIQLIIKKPLTERLHHFVCVGCEVTENVIKTQDFVSLIPIFIQFLTATIPTFFTHFQTNPFDPKAFLSQQLPVQPTISIDELTNLCYQVIEGIENVLKTEEKEVEMNGEYTTNVSYQLLLEESNMNRIKVFVDSLSEDECLTRLCVFDFAIIWFDVFQITLSPSQMNQFARTLFDLEKNDNQTVHIVSILGGFLSLLPSPKSIHENSFIDQNVFIYSFVAMLLNRPSQLLQMKDLRMILHTMRKVKRLLRHCEEDEKENAKEEAIIDVLFEGEGNMKRNEYIGVMASLLVSKEPEKVQLVKDLFTSYD